jgi:uncharacterized membrane protein YfhO
VILSRSYRVAFVGFLLFLLGTLIFRDFVFGNKVLLYKDIGSDSLNFHYPYFVHLSDYLRSEGLPRWSFKIGMGQSLFPYVNSLLLDPVTWLPRRLIAYGLVYQHLLKLIVCGFLFFKFLELRGLNFPAASSGAIFLSFSAYMCMGSCWTDIANEVVALTFVLFAIEKTFAKGRWIYLPFAVAVCGIVRPFHLYFCALLLVLYVVARFFATGQQNWRLQIRICVQLFVVASIGVGLAAVIWLDNLAAMFNSPRGSGIASYAGKLSSSPIFGFEKPLHYFTAVLRQFSNDIVGGGDNFRGWQNYLEAPAAYCGLLCLVMLPQVFVGADRRRRVIYASLLGIAGIATLFPWFRYAFWLFQGDYYRTFSLFCVFGIVILSMTALSRYIESGAINLWLLGITLFVLLAILYLPLAALHALIAPKIRTLVTVLLLTYAGLIAVGRYFRRERLAGWLLVLLSALELSYFDRITVAYRRTVTKQELDQRVGYNDYTVDAIRKVQSSENGFYRVTKLYSSSPAVDGSLNDALIFGYYGTTSYSSFNNANYIKFLVALDALPRLPTESETRWALGLNSRPLASTFACEKYVLTKNPVPLQMDAMYESVGQYGKIYLFRNKFPLPFGLFYTYFASQDSFINLTTTRKDRLLLEAVVLPGNSSDYESQIAPMSNETLKSIDSLAVPNMVEARRATAIHLRSFTQNRVVGEIDCEGAGILVFQTPFDLGWQAFVDGSRAPTLKADIGLIGLKLTRGKHLIELCYFPPFLKIGATITVLSLLVLGVGIWRWPRISPAVSGIAKIPEPVLNSGH